MSSKKSRIAAVAAAGALLVGAGAGGSVAAGHITGQDIVNGTVRTGDIADKTIRADDIRPGRIGMEHMRRDLREQFAENSESDAAPSPIYSESDKDIAITQMGGSWGTLTEPNATLLDTVTLPAGRYVLTTEGFFTADSDGNPAPAQIQVAVRMADGTKWGADLGTCFATTGVERKRDYTCSTTRTVELAADTDVQVFGFGYNVEDEGGSNSGEFVAESYLTALPVS